MITMRGTLITAALTALWLVTFSVSSLAATIPYVGTWILSVEKSRFRPGPPMKSETLIVRDAGDGLWHVTDDEVFGDGSTEHLEWSTRLDGTQNSVSGSSEIDSVWEQLTKSSTYRAAFKRSGQPIVSETARISADGKWMYSSLRGKSPNGAPWKYELVFERQ